MIEPGRILIAAPQGADIVTFLKTLEAKCASTLNIYEFSLCSYLVPDSLKKIYFRGNVDMNYKKCRHLIHSVFPLNCS